MAHSGSVCNEVIAKFGYQPIHIMTGMIKTEGLKIPSNTHIERKRLRPTGVLGDLDVLPLELLHMILSMVDLRTLLSILQTCSRGMAVVESLRQYRDLISFAAPAMAALGRSGLLRHHTASDLHAVLFSEQCASCGSFGAFLHLIRRTRCCYECLWRNQSLWVIPAALAKRCFKLKASCIKNLAVMRSIPGRYFLRNMISRHRQVRLVSVASAKELAIRDNVSEESLASDLDAQRAAGLALTTFYKLRWLHMAPLQPSGPELALRPIAPNTPNDEFCGMASLPFPSISKGDQIENGIWCRGCEHAHRTWSHSTTLPEDVASLIPAGVNQSDALTTLQYIARTRTEFLDHIKTCRGAQELGFDLLAEFRQTEYP